jgi:hypothetical protein
VHGVELTASIANAKQMAISAMNGSTDPMVKLVARVVIELCDASEQVPAVRKKPLAIAKKKKGKAN